MTRRDKRPRKGGDAADPRPAGGRWRLRNWRLGTKLFAVLLIPALAVIALVGLRISSDLRDARQLAEFATRGRVDSTVAEALHELQRERDLTVRFVAQNRQGDTADLTAQRTRVDKGIGTFERTLAESKPRLDAKAAESLQQTDDRLRVLGGLRFSAEHSAFPADAVLRSYSELISGLLDISDSAAADVADPELARMRLAGNALARIKDQMSVKRAVMAEALASGTLNRDRTRALLGAEAELAAARSDYRTFATPDQQRMFDDTVIGLVVDIGNDMVESALTRTENGQNLSGLDPNQWDTSATHTVNLAHQVQQALLVQLQERTDALAAQARTAALWDGGVVLGVLLVAGVLSVVIARSLLRPLRILRRTALEVAEHRLPAAVQNLLTDPEPAPENLRKRLAVAPVPVFTREELGQVARAFDAVHGEAVRLAGEQAMLRENVNAMFVNLSQRSQDLVERQLSVLDRMEADEQDPDTLAGLFELDHLATRMRRNSENLLVLSGNDSAREDAGPVPADEIIGAALSEVEHYQRIELGPAPQVAVRGEAVNDLVHVVSELLENATRYSGDEMVTVASAETHDGDWQIEIVDHGAGMPQAEIDRTNARLAHPPDVDVEVSRRMGLFVVATLATRHHIDVSLSAGADSGLVATVLVPAALIVELPPMPAPPPPAEPAAVPEPELLAPLAPLTPPEPEPEPEPEELSPPSIEAGPPRRAPVVARDHPPEWPTVDDEAHLDLDAPTERMPAYRDVLSRWFDASAAPEQPRKPAEPLPVAEAPRPPEPQPRPAEPQPRHALAAPPPPLPSREAPPPPLLPSREAPAPPLPAREAPAPPLLPARETPPLPSREAPLSRETPAEAPISGGSFAPEPVDSPLLREIGEPRPDDEDTEPRLTPVAPPAAVEPAYEWPTPAELEQEDGAEDTWPFLQPLDSAASPGAVPEQRPILSLSPEAVRERMTSLQGGFRRGRHARGDDTRNQ
ncbi:MULTISPECIES: nitrate- and nitrite sensing domain-containing protein [unclassified Amycolatopsis]|uniref:sensor histidine kinase n=1 Tax=unclassified Amycolatopsis TaxID=2618356 RepID=UPI0028747AC9|nr:MULTISPECIES: nitrate- and nitrite sensing domain-containing protein [unclassified Amycolatopsis]MDS0133443.1 nitrate- and nitrite sensing domain-containing protein [Amycolatopsis sp. 505]MDS0146673.1 nitrate- and nitrite sensing domain-containing protein [Amycolatopsis sp. CM201R]